MLELRKRHLEDCAKWEEGYPFSPDLNCKRCPYFAFGRLNGKKVRRSLDTTDRQEAAWKLLQMEADAKAPTKHSVAEARDKFAANRKASGNQKSATNRRVDSAAHSQDAG